MTPTRGFTRPRPTSSRRRGLTATLVAIVTLALLAPAAATTATAAPGATAQTAAQIAAQTTAQTTAQDLATRQARAKALAERAAAVQGRANALSKRASAARARAASLVKDARVKLASLRKAKAGTARHRALRVKTRKARQAARTANARAARLGRQADAWAARATLAHDKARQAAGAVAAPGGRTTGDVVRMANANIKFGMAASRFEADLTTVLSDNPDFVTLNEVGQKSVEHLSSRPGYLAYKPARARLNGNAVLWRTDRWEEVRSSARQIVDEGPMKYDRGRGASYTILRSLEDGREISVVSVHHMQNPAKFERRHRAQRQALYQEGMERLKTLVTQLSSRGPVFVGGDFNSGYHDANPWAPRTHLRQIGVQSAMDVMGKQPTHDQGGTIDYIFYQTAHASPISQAITNLHSDHHLMLNDFQLVTATARR